MEYSIALVWVENPLLLRGTCACVCQRVGILSYEFFSYTPSHRLPENIYGSLLSNGLNSERVCDKKG